MRLGLGTVQFGIRYGIANSTGQPSRMECMRIVQRALDAGIEYFDTASYYMGADAILNFALNGRPAKVVTKVRSQRDVERSKALFGRNLYAILGRGPIADFDGKTGQSVYWQAPDQEVDIVQLPLNLADQRNLPMIRDYHAKGVEVHARSVFLQGLLLQRGATIRQCLKFVLDQPVDVAIVGVNSVKELEDILEAMETLDQENSSFVPFIEPEMLDPRTWSA